jgi:histidinol phosphatase-like PHP family hydrolase
MIDLHAHTFLSDGCLGAFELFRRAVVHGYKAFGITDHVDLSNMERVLDELTRASDDLRGQSETRLIPGVEITHVPPRLIPQAIDRAKALGAKIVLVHGESPVEPVQSGTNRAAIEGRADILAHPGLISEEDVALAKEKGVLLEISGRAGHCLTNGRLVLLARKAGARLVINSDTHAPEQLLTEDMRKRVGLGAGLSEEELLQTSNNAEDLVRRVLKG